jgi:hypothetical protein
MTYLGPQAANISRCRAEALASCSPRLPVSAPAHSAEVASDVTVSAPPPTAVARSPRDPRLERHASLGSPTFNEMILMERMVPFSAIFGER